MADLASMKKLPPLGVTAAIGFTAMITVLIANGLVLAHSQAASDLPLQPLWMGRWGWAYVVSFSCVVVGLAATRLSRKATR